MIPFTNLTALAAQALLGHIVELPFFGDFKYVDKQLFETRRKGV